MADKKNKVIGVDVDEEKVMRNEWRDFSQTLAFKRMMEYADTQSAMLLRYAEEMAMPLPSNVVDNKSRTQVVPLSVEKSHSLLQNKRGIGIMTSYIRLYCE